MRMLGESRGCQLPWEPRGRSKQRGAFLEWPWAGPEESILSPQLGRKGEPHSSAQSR
jgi:hypothetical protein